jgi:hypothetical protein
MYNFWLGPQLNSWAVEVCKIKLSCFWLSYFIVTRLFEKKGDIEIGSVRQSVSPSHFRVRSITLSFIKGIWNNLAQMFVILRRVMRNNQTPTSRVKVALAISTKEIRLYIYSIIIWTKFSKNEFPLLIYWK